jgi:hypothetical protein
MVRAVKPTGRPVTKMKSLRSLQYRAAVAWGGLVLSALLIWGQHQLRVLHPWSLAFLFLLMVTYAAALGGLFRGLWRTLRGPQRARAFGWTILAVLPATGWALLGLYGSRSWGNRAVPNNPAFTLVKIAGASLMEAQARYLYPHRLETQRLVMFYRDGLEDPTRDAATMDRHVAHLEELTGLPIREKIYWVRGPLLGQKYLSLYGLALGTLGGAPSRTDRHELAHAIMSQHNWPATDPPTCLAEGWAESQSGDSSRDLAMRALAVPSGHRSLRVLTGPDWYHRDIGPIYDVGGALVDFLLRRYGAERFVDLYFACRPGTFEAECRRIYGVEADALEAEFWAEARRVAD